MKSARNSISYFFLFYCIFLAVSTLSASALGCPARDDSGDTCPQLQFADDDSNNNNSLEYLMFYHRAASLASHATKPWTSRIPAFRHTMSSSSSAARPDEQPQQTSTTYNPESSSTRLALPEVPTSSSDGTPKLDISGGGGGGGQGSTVSLDHLGPIVVNQDGTMSRISNWAQMTEMEQKNTLRIVGKRNQQRLQALKDAGVEGST